MYFVLFNFGNSSYNCGYLFSSVADSLQLEKSINEELAGDVLFEVKLY